jgi:hypothetical protein
MSDPRPGGRRLSDYGFTALIPYNIRPEFIHGLITRIHVLCLSLKSYGSISPEAHGISFLEELGIGFMTLYSCLEQITMIKVGISESQHFVKHNAKRTDVASVVDCPPQKPLGAI